MQVNLLTNPSEASMANGSPTTAADMVGRMARFTLAWLDEAKKQGQAIDDDALLALRQIAVRVPELKMEQLHRDFVNTTDPRFTAVVEQLPVAMGGW